MSDDTTVESRRRARWVGAALVVASSGAIGFLPLFSGPGYEHGLATGLTVPTIAAMVAALESFRDRSAVADETPFAAIARGALLGLSYAALALATSLVHGLRVGLCDPLAGIWTFAQTAWLGSILAGCVGSAWALSAAHGLDPSYARRRWSTALAGVTPLATALTSVTLFYATPAVFAYDPFVGFFSGTLYDEVVDARGPLLTYRAGTLLTLAALALVAHGLDRARDGRLSVTFAGRVLVGVAAGCASLALIFAGERLGHRSSSRHIAHVLGASRVGARCDVIYPASDARLDGALLLRDCEESLAEVEARLGVRGPPRVTAFFFRDSEQKRALMGAADTYIAKPWRREVYLQVAPYPHPVLGHELAHVVAGAIAPAPFHVAGALRGVWPNPGLIEGVAVAASPDRDELTARAWSKAMRDLNILPSLDQIFGPGFLAQNSSMAYTVAGAFIGHQLDAGRGAAVRAWYSGATFERAFGTTLAAAETEFVLGLDAIVLSKEAAAVAKARFERPAIWFRKCPHVVERLREQASECRADGRLHDADEKLRALLRLDVADPSARLELAQDAKQEGDRRAYVDGLRALIGDARLSSPWQARVYETLGDEALRTGELEAASEAYSEAKSRVIEEDRARNLEVKLYVSTSAERAGRVGRLLVGSSTPGDDQLAARLAIARTSSAPDASSTDVALAQYLLGRMLYDAKTFADADAYLAASSARALEVITPRLARERARLRLLIACAESSDTRAASAQRAWHEYLEAPPANDGRRLQVERLAHRCGAL